MFYKNYSDAASEAARLRREGYTGVYINDAYGQGPYAGKVVGYWVGGTPPSKPPGDGYAPPRAPERDTGGGYDPPPDSGTTYGSVEAWGYSGTHTDSFTFYFKVPHKGGRFRFIDYTVYVNGTEWTSEHRQSGDQSVFLDIDRLLEGRNSIRIKGRDNSTPYTSFATFDETFYFTVNKNKAPSIYTSTSNYGEVKKDFDLVYTVSDDKDSTVDVQIEIDYRVKQAYKTVTSGQSQRYPIKIKDYSDGSHTVVIRAKDSQGAVSTRNLKFERNRIAPKVIIDEAELGSIFKDFEVAYMIVDEDSEYAEVTIKVDDTIVQKPTRTSLGIRKIFGVDVDDLDLGTHTITITARDDEGQSSSGIYYFTIVNSAPVISGQDENLGAKNIPFTYTYTVDDREDDNITVIEKVNGKVVRNLSNVQTNTEYVISVTREQIQALELGEIGTITIEVKDDKGSTAYRYIKFSRDNAAPTISGYDTDLGEIEKEFTYKYQVSDPENDKVYVSVYLDNQIISPKEEKKANEDIQIKISGFDFLSIPYGNHTVRIVATDDIGNRSERTISFSRVPKRLVMQLAKGGIETDELASKILVSTAGVYLAKGAVLKVEVCNNSFDAKPTWEDATKMTEAGKAFNFQNLNKTASKAGINIRFTIERADARTNSYITAIGGSYE